MAKTVKIGRSTISGRFVTRAIGPRKATKFASVEGLELSAASREIAQNTKSRGLRGDAYRAEIVKAFKKS
ncbi:hypothetical protein [Oricola thermophila]|uniref:Uncharacterized protein n=1 Tax=Oricola thermophila TaxID=2742145 RepID=A0A6N1VDN7_9HYPH|nr:hypothetical protein [Oricola thermophila]QKV18643.1 hypothetical protein HTY61_09380 [Oricola thermophila]